MQRGGKLGLVRYVGVLVEYADNSPSYRVWNPRKAKKVANVGEAEFDESVGRAWWKGGLGGGNLVDMEVVIFPDAEGDGDVPADGVGGGGPPETGQQSHDMRHKVFTLSMVVDGGSQGSCVSRY